MIRWPLDVDWLTGEDGRPEPSAPGRLALSSCPGRPDSAAQLRDDLQLLRGLSIETVVSLADESEMAIYGVTGLHEAVVGYGMRHLRYPFPDGQPPPDQLSTRLLCQQLLGLLGEGQNVLLHCIGGWGRSGTVAAALLCHEGYGPEAAIAAVRRARSPRCVQSMAQERFVHRYHKELQGFARRYWPVRQSDVGRALAGEPGARVFSPGLELARPMALQDVPAWVTAWRRREPVVLLSGPMLRAEVWPPRQGCLGVDRAYLIRAGAPVPVPLWEIL